jgi:hypothetical protein
MLEGKFLLTLRWISILRVREQGHQVRLIPAQFVMPYRKTNKNDFINAEAITEAVAKHFASSTISRNSGRGYTGWPSGFRATKASSQSPTN